MNHESTIIFNSLLDIYLHSFMAFLLSVTNNMKLHCYDDQHHVLKVPINLPPRRE